MSQTAACFILILVLAGIAPMGRGATLNNRGSQSQRPLTPLQFEIEQQRERLSAPEIEDRRDAVMRLAAIRHPAASRAVIPALRDPSPLVRATAASAVLGLPEEESAALLLPILADRDEFVRREVAYALGKTGRPAVSSLIEVLNRDREDSVRGAAAVALGELQDEAAVVPLAQILVPPRRARQTRNAFVLMAAARSLGQIGSRAGVTSLIATLDNSSMSDEVRREAAISLGMIGDPVAAPSLRQVVTAKDPYLAQAAVEALKKLSL